MTKLCNKIIFTIAFFLLTASFSHALLKWEPTNGPCGGVVTRIDIASDDGTVYAGTFGGGVFVSTDLGLSWLSSSEGIVNYSNKIMALRAGRAGVAFVSPQNMGIYRSDDRGVSWFSKNNDIGDYSVNDIAVDPLDNNKIYIATMTAGVYKSTDEAESWVPTGLKSDVSPVTCLSIVPSGGGKTVIYAGTATTALNAWVGNGIWKSTDEGITWTRISTPEVWLDNRYIYSIAAAPSGPNMVYASDAWAVYKSRNGGISWEVTSVPAANNIDVDPVSPEVFYASSASGLYKTTNEGTTNTTINTSGEPYFWDTAIKPDDDSVVLAGDIGSGMFKSTDYGASFNVSNAGINNAIIKALETASVEGRTFIYAAAAAQYPNLRTQNLGIFRSTDEGQSWTLLNSFFRTQEVFVTYVNPASPETVYAGLYNNIPCLFKSSDSGNTWKGIDIGPGTTVLYDISADPRSAEVIYAATSGMVYRSNDYGENWNSWTDGAGGTPCVIHAAWGSQETYVCLGTSAGIYTRWTSGGVWNNSSHNATEPVYGNHVFAIDDVPTRETVYMSYSVYGRLASKGIYNETPTAWSFSGYGIGNAGNLVTDKENPFKYYACSNNTKKFFSYDEKRSPVGVAEMYGLPSLNATYTNYGITTYLSFDIWRVKMDPTSPPYARKIYSSPPGRSVWRAQEISEAIPAAPSNLHGLALGTSSIKWLWTDNSLNEKGFKLYKPPLPPGTLVGQTPQSIATTIEGGLSTNEACLREVFAYNDAGTSAGSLATAYTMAAVPGAPNAKDIGIRYITITWESGGNPPGTSYEVWSSTPEAGSGFPLYWTMTGVLGTTEYADTGLSYEAVYWYKVRALNGDGITTEFSSARSFMTLPPLPSEDVYPPKITNVRFDGRAYFNKDIIYHTPRVSAVLTDYASTEPSYVTPEGVDRRSVRIRFGDYLFEDLPSSAFTTVTPTIEVFDYQIPSQLGALNYVCTIEAADLAWPWFNKGIWNGSVTVMGDRVQVIGPALAYPTPFSPLSDKLVTLSYNLSTNADVAFYMYDISGQVILTKKFSAGIQGGKAGYNQFTWNGKSDFGQVVGNGIYIFKIVSKGRSIGTGKLVVMD